MTEFDYVIVGAGSAGCVLADRLSADGKSQVLLVEAGSRNSSPLLSMPRGYAKLWQDPRYYWLFPIEEESWRPKGETWVYGKGLGGSSAVNGTWYYRGQPEDYDAWKTVGEGLWDWSQIQRCFREMEDYREEGAHASRGRGGPLQVTTVKMRSPLTEAVLAAGREMGVPTVTDVNAPAQPGFGYTQMTVDRDGRRVTSYTAFLKSARTRPNLTVLTGVRTRRILFDGKRAAGLLCDSDRGQIRLAARSEVIVCAGVLQSPKLLQLSGVGPKALLDRHAVPVVHDLPAVGRNMAEHMMLSVSFRLKGMAGLNREFRGWRLWKNALQYFLFRKGLMAYGLPEISAMIASGAANPSWPDIQLGVSPYSYAASAESKAEPGRGQTEEEPGVTVTGFCLRPASRGSVEIRSANIDDPPLVRANWLSEAEDRQALIGLVKLIRRLMAQPALKPFVGEETVPGAAIRTDEDIEQATRWMLSTGLHGTGACRMGGPTDGVVDARLRVHGVDRLRVVDCSAMPTAISGNTSGPAMAMAWRAAELILEDRDRILDGTKEGARP